MEKTPEVTEQVEKEIVPEIEPIVDEVVVEKKETRALHKTTSIFLRNLTPTITKAEVEAVSTVHL